MCKIEDIQQRKNMYSMAYFASGDFFQSNSAVFFHSYVRNNKILHWEFEGRFLKSNLFELFPLYSWFWICEDVNRANYTSSRQILQMANAVTRSWRRRRQMRSKSQIRNRVGDSPVRSSEDRIDPYRILR